MKLLKRKAGSKKDLTLRLYYASDVHGSDQCWRKFLGAGKFYDVQALVMGGDLTGKAIVPVRALPDGSHAASLLGDERVARTEQELEELASAIRYNGMYPWLVADQQVAAYAEDAVARDGLFDEVILTELRRWMQLADRRLNGSDVELLIMAGNDDPWNTDEVLRTAPTVTFCDDQIVQVRTHEVLSSSYSNLTPWNSPRELDEDLLYARLRPLADQLEHPERAIFNIHVPPYDSGLDTAAEIDPDTMSPVLDAGNVREIPVGSRAVRQLIEEVQPLLSLHGHIHESRGMKNIGRTLAINSGSEYNSGRIHGALVGLAGDRVATSQLVVG